MKLLSKLTPAKEPEMVCKVGISWVFDLTREIYFDTDAETARTIEKFGIVKQEKGANHYSLCVDARYNFRAVLNYLKSL